ncbi:growth-regulating factor 7-like isoform X1 [Typha angustifolia]|uniref:growth-regulating factor 7-like isoform X1 n=1 Tax=Typha angustifolia TaxID=59011 RepID=UPI003C2E6750
MALCISWILACGSWLLAGLSDSSSDWKMIFSCQFLHSFFCLIKKKRKVFSFSQIFILFCQLLDGSCRQRCGFGDGFFISFPFSLWFQRMERRSFFFLFFFQLYFWSNSWFCVSLSGTFCGFSYVKIFRCSSAIASPSFFLFCFVQYGWVEFHLAFYAYFLLLLGFCGSGLSSGSSTVSMNGLLSRVRGPFTPSQWMELEHQALIYKYITANVQIPASLLIPIRRSLNPSGFNPFSAGCFGSSTLGWGSFHLGYSGNGDPEPGRCRRTDGKKWRCSRDAVGDQKYCERHMNRGRHRSRKHVEGQSGHAAKATSAIVSSQSVSAVSGSKSSGSLTTAQQQTKDSSLNLADPCSSQFNRMLTSKENVDDFAKDSHSPSLVSSMNQKAIDSLFLASKQHNPFEEASSRVDFGLFSTESLMNSPRSSEITSFIPTPKLNEQSQPHLLRQFIDDSPKSQSDRSNARPSETEEMQSERTQLSISIPLASLDFSSSTSSPDDKLKLSPLKLSHEYNPIEMGLGVGGGILTEVSQRQASWMPISWETSVGGPLGEALTSTSNAPKDQSKNCSSSSINLLTDCWDSSPRFVSSPTGVLQKTAFGSVSSSTRSSPRPEIYKTHDSTGSLCDDLLGSTLVNLSTIPLL